MNLKNKSLHPFTQKQTPSVPQRIPQLSRAGETRRAQQWGTSTRFSRESYSYMVRDILKGRQTLQLKWINFIVCKLFLDSVDEKTLKSTAMVITTVAHCQHLHLSQFWMTCYGCNADPIDMPKRFPSSPAGLHPPQSCPLLCSCHMLSVTCSAGWSGLVWSGGRGSKCTGYSNGQMDLLHVRAICQDLATLHS